MKRGVPARMDFGVRLFRVGQAWRREVDAELRVHGLTDATWRPMLHLGRAGDGLTQKELAALLHIEGPSLVRQLDALEEAGLVERRARPADRRSKAIHMTERGRSIYQTVIRAASAVADDLLSTVPAEDFGRTSAVIEQIEQAVDRRRAARGGQDE